MKAGWKTESLGSVCGLIARGVAPKYVEDGGILVLNQKCVRDHRVNPKLGRRHDDSQRAVRADRIIELGDVLVNSTGTGTLGRVAQVRIKPAEPMTVDTHVTIVRPQQRKFYPDFFGYMMIQIEDQLAVAGEGASGQTELARSTLADNFEVSYPDSLDEQRRIVAVLDKAFAGIATATANAQKNLTNARAIFQIGLENTFENGGNGWETKPFADLCTIKHGFAFKSEFFAPEGDFVLLTPGNFYESGGYRDRGAKQKFYVGEVPSDFVLDEGDLLVAMTEQADGLLGSPIVVPEGATFLHNQRLGLVKAKTGVPWCNEFFFHAFNTKAVRLMLRRTGTGAKVRHTSPNKIGAVEISYPRDLVQQRQVAAKLTALESQASELAQVQIQKLAALAELKQSLLQKAFAGELT